MNIFGLLMAFSINLGITIALGKDNQWAWRVPIVVMQVFPLVLMSLMGQLPETPRWFMSRKRKDDARTALKFIYGEEASKSKYKELKKAHRTRAKRKLAIKICSYLAAVNSTLA
jgi:hypothetical protein